ncbi:DUF2834 domain-containing protein [Marinomonas posidonica]|uniref:DUF2834 domain-containing protein n=1 Tax=Marinomonas posidonica TaxID=936476 RepID=UPI003735EC26
MNIKHLYLLLCVVGTLVPLSQFVPWVLEHRVNIPLFFDELFQTRIGAFFGLDVVISALALFAFMFYETKQRKIAYAWTAVLGTLCIGVSLGLPLFLYLRQRSVEQGH